MDTSKELTDFDSLICDHHLQMLKAAIPYLPAQGQQFLSVYTKSLELSKTISLLRKEDVQSVGICSVSDSKKNTTDMLNTIKKYCTDSEREMLELFTNFVSAFRMYNSYKELFPSENNEKNSNPMDALKTMLTPEQKTMFDTYSSLLSSQKL